MAQNGESCLKRFFLENHTITGYGGRNSCAIKKQESGGSDINVLCDDNCPFVEYGYSRFDLKEFELYKESEEKNSLHLKELVKRRDEEEAKTGH